MSIDQDIANSAKQLEADVEINHQITHGGDTVEVPTEGGPVPSIRKRLKDIETEWAKTADPLADNLASTVQVTKGYKDDADTSAAEAAEEVPKVQAEGVKQVKTVTDQGAASVEQVKVEGSKQTGLVNSAGASNLNKVNAAGETAKQAASQAQAIANKFGDVDGAVTAATHQANRATAEADRAKEAATGVVTETGDKIKEIQAAGSAEVGKVNSAGAGQVTSIEKTGTEQLQAVSTVGNNKKQEITTTADGKIADINALIGGAEAIVDQAQTAANEAKEAEANATAIVHNDEGSVTPKAGAYPVADSNGHLDVNRTPLLAAMYPYSGVIGSINKGDLFTFYTDQDSTWANDLVIKARQFNINGRFVDKAQEIITLPKAESTAERAIAFDDIFLDWNGTVQTYRSITPHRTTTGYDRDAIATEHGYSKIQTGLYKTGETYALLLGRVARRNQGGYHPVYNLEGSCPYVSTSGRGCQWWNPDLDLPAQPKNQEQCFYFRRTDGVQVSNSGKIGGVGWQIPRPDKKPYDAIFADDFTPLYYSAKNVVDRQALLFDSFNRAVTGETFSSSEVNNSLVYECSILNSSGYPVFLNSNNLYRDKHFPKSCLKVVNLRTGTSWENMDFYFVSSGTETYIRHDLSDDIQIGDQIYIKLTPEVQEGVTNNLSTRPQFLMVDIIGSLDAMPEEWKTNGIPGNWLSVGEEGESLIPDGTSKNFKLSRKCLECHQVLKTVDKGVNWSNVTSSWKSNLEGNFNSQTDSATADTVYMVFYRTSANPFELADDQLMLLYSATVLATQLTPQHTSIGTNLIGKVLTGQGGGDVHQMQMDNSPFTFWGEYYQGNWHSQIQIAIRNSPTIKVYGGLDSDMNLRMFYKEIKNNGTQWGDDNKFNVVNKQSTVTDLNGETVIVGQKRLELPYQFDGVQY